MDLKEDLKKALGELRKGKERKFEQTVDLIINLQKYDQKKNPLNLVLSLPNIFKEKKVCAFLEMKNPRVYSIMKQEFKKYSNKKSLKKLVREYDFFIAQVSLMPSVATTFGKVLGPAGKMPSPQLGILVNVDDKILDEMLDKVNRSVKIRTKDPNIKLAIGKEKMDDDKIIENVLSVYNSVVKALVRDKENVKNLELKFTMTKPVKIKIR